MRALAILYHVSLVSSMVPSIEECTPVRLPKRAVDRTVNRIEKLMGSIEVGHSGIFREIKIIENSFNYLNSELSMLDQVLCTGVPGEDEFMNAVRVLRFSELKNKKLILEILSKSIQKLKSTIRYI